MVYTTDGKGVITYASAQFLHSMDYEKHEMVGKPYTNFIQTQLKTLKPETHLKSNEMSFIKKDGSYLNVIQFIVAEKESSSSGAYFSAYLHNLNNYTKKIKSQSALIDKFHLSFKNSRVAMWDYDIKSGRIYWQMQNFNFYETAGFRKFLSIEEIMNMIHPEDAPNVMSSLQEAISSGKSSLSVEFRVPLKSGKLKYISTYCNIERNSKGEITSIVGIDIDVTSLKRTEEQLALLNYRFKMAIESSKMGVWDWDIESDKSYWCERMYKMYGATSEDKQFDANRWCDRLHPDDKEEGMRTQKESLRTGKDYVSEFRIIYKNNEIRHIKAFGCVLKNREGKAIRMIGVNIDVTAEKQTQSALIHAQKFSALGEMTGEVAHEINNPLSIIDGYVDRLLRNFEKNEILIDPTLNDLRKIKRTVARIANIVKGMRRYTLYARRNS